MQLDKFFEAYQDFLKGKIVVKGKDGDINTPSPMFPFAYGHQKAACEWAWFGKRRAIFASFGLGKSICQLQLMKWVHERTGKKVLFVVPLGVRQEFINNDGPMCGMEIKFCRTTQEALDATTPYILTNYESIREDKLDPSFAAGATLDEASFLRSLGSKTTQTFIEKFKDIEYRYVATATPSPNSTKEIIHYAHFLGINDTGEILTRFFQRNSKTAGDLQLMPKQEKDFWLWVASWGLFINKPSDLGFSDEGYDLPPFEVKWHCVGVDYTRGHSQLDSRGQGRLMPKDASSLSEASKEAKATLKDRIDYAASIIESENPDKHWLLWHYLEDERAYIQKRLPQFKAVFGAQKDDVKENLILGFEHGEYQYLAPKPQMLGSGCNFQRHCSDAIFVGPSHKFNDFIQAVHRIYRYGQTKPVTIHIIYAETQTAEKDNLTRKWAEHDKLVKRMSNIIKEHGLSSEALRMTLQRNLGQKINTVTGDNFTVNHGDTVEITALMEDNSVDQIVTSIPFSDHYEYSPNYSDFGHNQGDNPFFQQMDFLVPNLLRVLKPGRVACIHTKDRIEYGRVTGNGMYTVNEFSDKTVQCFKKHGFMYMGRICIDADVVRENAQTYRLGHTENSKDSTKMGCGSLEYVLLFRKWHPDMSPNNNAYGPNPVTKVVKQPENPDNYSLSSWQIQASGIWRSSGDRLVDPDILGAMSMADVKRWWKRHCETNGYDYDTHLALCENLEKKGELPASWMLFAPHSANPDVWTDILRIDTLNTKQSQKAEMNHVCPLQIDVIRRLVERYSNEGDVVFDPFLGVGSTAYKALKMGRKAVGNELNAEYWRYAVGYCEDVEASKSVPTLFDLAQFTVAV